MPGTATQPGWELTNAAQLGEEAGARFRLCRRMHLQCEILFMRKSSLQFITNVMQTAFECQIIPGDSNRPDTMAQISSAGFQCKCRRIQRRTVRPRSRRDTESLPPASSSLLSCCCSAAPSSPACCSLAFAPPSLPLPPPPLLASLPLSTALTTYGCPSFAACKHSFTW